MRIVVQPKMKLVAGALLALIVVLAGCSFESSLQDVRCSEEGERSEGRVCENGLWVGEASGDTDLDAQDAFDTPGDVAPDADTGDCLPNQMMCDETCVDILTSADHCGGCAQACTADGEHTIAECAQGSCERSCEEGFRDEDGDWTGSDGSEESNGCEASCVPTEEVCNGVDDNCDGDVDEGVTTTYYLDADQDGFGVMDDAVEACGPDGQYSATEAGDCDDAVIATNPDAAELCNGADDDCDGDVDEDCSCIGSETADCYNGDAGTAGVGPCIQGTKTCDGAGEWGSCQGEVIPESEICGDGVDNDCDGDADCADSDCDAQSCGDDDEVCSSGVCCSPQTDEAFCNNQAAQCGPVSSTDNCGVQRTDVDCGGCGGGSSCSNNTCAEDNCGDGKDNDGDGDVDCFDSDCAGSPTTYYFDNDDDGYGLGSDSIQACSPNGNHRATDPGDCDDADNRTFPGAAPNDSTTDCMRDDDEDDWGDANAPSGGSAGSDCDDNDSARNPDATEECGDDVDSDCDGSSDDSDPDANAWCDSNVGTNGGCGVAGGTACCLAPSGNDCK